MIRFIVESIFDYMDHRNSKHNYIDHKSSKTINAFKDSENTVSAIPPEEKGYIIPMEKKKIPSTKLEHPEIAPPEGCPACRKIADKW